MLNGDDRFRDVVHIVARCHARDEITVQAVGGGQATLKGRIHCTGLHGVGDVDVRDLDPSGTRRLDPNGDVHGTVPVFWDVIVEGIHQRWCLLDDFTNRRVVAGDHGGLVEEDVGLPIVGTIAAHVQHRPVGIALLVLENEFIDARRNVTVRAGEEDGIAEGVAGGFRRKTGFLVVGGIQPRAAVVVGNNDVKGGTCGNICGPRRANFADLGTGVEVR